MYDFPLLLSLAYKAELKASRRLSERTGVSDEDALRATLEQAAGVAGIDALVTQRQAVNTASAERRAEREEHKAAALMLRQARHDGPATPWRAWFDGSAHPNPGRCGIGGLLAGPGGERIEISQHAGYGNSSQAEYLALIAVLQAAVDVGATGLTVYGDSQGVIDDANGPDQEAAVSLADLRRTAKALMVQLDGPALRWIPRHKNGQADALSQRAVSQPG